MSRRAYRLLVHQRDPTSATVDYALSSEIKELPTIPGPVARPLDGRTETQPWTLPVTDYEGAITSRIADETGHMHQLGRIAQFQRKDEDGPWETIYTGRIAGLTEPTPGRWDIRIADERWYERQEQIHTRADTTLVWPLGMRVRWRHGLSDAEVAKHPPLWIVSEVTADRHLRLVAASDPSRYIAGGALTSAAIDLIRADRRAEASTTSESNYRTLRFRELGGSGRDLAVIGFDTHSTLQEHRPRATFDESLVAGEPLSEVWIQWPETEPVPNGAAGYLYAPDHEPSRTLPLHIGAQDPEHEWGAPEGEPGVHPFEHVRRSYERTGTRYNPDRFDELIQDASYGRASWRITASGRLAQWAERHVYKPTLVLPFCDNQGRVAPRSLLPPPGLDPDTLFVFDASNTKGPPPVFDHQDGERRNVVEVEGDGVAWAGHSLELSEHETLDGYAPSDWRPEPIRHPDVDTDENPVPLAPERRAAIDLSGWWLTTTQQGLHERFARHVLDRFGDGPIDQVIHGMEDTREVAAGDWVLIDQDSLRGPNPATNARSGLRLVQILKRDILNVGYRYEILDGGPALQPLSAPSLSVSRGSDTRHSIEISVSDVDPDARSVELEIAYDPDFTRLVRTLAVGAGTHKVRPLASGVTVYIRVRATAPGRTMSVWSQTDDVATDALPAPTGLSATILGRTILLGWSPQASGYALLPTLEAEPALPSPLPPDSTSYVFDGLEEALQYELGVRHVDPWGGASPIASVSATTDTSTVLAAPRRMRVLQGRSDPARATGIFGLGALGIGLQVGFKAIERQAKHRVQVARDALFADPLYEVSVRSGREHANLPTPLITDRLFARVRAEADGYEPSPWSAVVSAYATALLSDPPSSDHFPGGWADLHIDASGSVSVILGSDDPDTDRIYWAAGTTGFPTVTEASDYVEHDDLPKTVDPGLTLQPDDTVYLAVRYWSAVSGFGQGLLRAEAWRRGPKGEPGDGSPSVHLRRDGVTASGKARYRLEAERSVGGTNHLTWRRRYYWVDGGETGWPEPDALGDGEAMFEVDADPDRAMQVEVQVFDTETGRSTIVSAVLPAQPPAPPVVHLRRDGTSASGKARYRVQAETAYGAKNGLWWRLRYYYADGGETGWPTYDAMPDGEATFEVEAHKKRALQIEVQVEDERADKRTIETTVLPAEPPDPRPTVEVRTAGRTTAGDQRYRVAAERGDGGTSGLQWRQRHYWTHTPETEHPGWPVHADMTKGAATFAVEQHLRYDTEIEVQVHDPSTEKNTIISVVLPSRASDYTDEESTRVREDAEEYTDGELDDRGLYDDGFDGPFGRGPGSRPVTTVIDGTDRARDGLDSDGRLQSGHNTLDRIGDSQSFRRTGAGYVDEFGRVGSIWTGSTRYDGQTVGSGVDRATTGLDSQGRAQVGVTDTADIAGRAARLIRAQVEGGAQNLMPSGSGAVVNIPTGETRYPGRSLRERDILLSSLGVEPGRIVSLSGVGRRTGADGKARLGVGWVDDAGEVIRYDTVDRAATTDAVMHVADIEIPSGAVAARPFYGHRDGDHGSARMRGFTLTLGPIPQTPSSTPAGASAQNLMPAGSGASTDVPTGGTHYAGRSSQDRDIPLAQMGLAPGDVVTYSAVGQVTSTGGVARTGVGWVDSGGDVINYTNAPDHEGTSEKWMIREGITIPDYAVALRQYYGERGSGSVRFHSPMLHRGDRAIPYESPPLRADRETVDDLPDGTQFRRTTPDEATGGGRGFAALDEYDRLRDQRHAPVVMSGNAGSVQTGEGDVLTVTLDPINDRWVINIRPHGVRYGHGEVQYFAAELYVSRAANPSGGVRYVYCDDPDMDGGSVSYAMTTDPATVIRGGRYFVGTVEFSGGGGSGGSDGAGAGNRFRPGG